MLSNFYLAVLGIVVGHAICKHWNNNSSLIIQFGVCAITIALGTVLLVGGMPGLSMDSKLTTILLGTVVAMNCFMLHLVNKIFGGTFRGRSNPKFVPAFNISTWIVIVVIVATNSWKWP